MSRENRRKVMGAVFGLLGFLAVSRAATAWELPLSGWQVQNKAEIGRLWQLAWSEIQAIWSQTNYASDSDAGLTTTTPSVSGNLSDQENHAEHSVGIDPNG